MNEDNTKSIRTNVLILWKPFFKASLIILFVTYISSNILLLFFKYQKYEPKIFGLAIPLVLSILLTYKIINPIVDEYYSILSRRNRILSFIAMVSLLITGFLVFEFAQVYVGKTMDKLSPIQTIQNNDIRKFKLQKYYINPKTFGVFFTMIETGNRYGSHYKLIDYYAHPILDSTENIREYNVWLGVKMICNQSLRADTESEESFKNRINNAHKKLWLEHEKIDFSKIKYFENINYLPEYEKFNLAILNAGITNNNSPVILIGHNIDLEKNINFNLAYVIICFVGTNLLWIGLQYLLLE
jgi:hypothetical protein